MEYLFRHRSAGSLRRQLQALMVLSVFSAAVSCCLAGDVMPPADRQAFADGLYARGHYALAAEEYRSLLRRHPEWEQADTVLYRLGESLRREGQSAAAEAAYTRLIAAYPGSPYAARARLRRFERLIAQGEYAPAAEGLSAMTKEDLPPELAGAVLYEHGYALARAGQPESAAEPLMRLVEEYDRHPLVTYACLELARLKEAAGREVEVIMPYYRRAVESGRDNRAAAEALFQKAEYAFRVEEYDAAARTYSRLLADHPEDPRAREARLQAAWSYRYAGRCADALAILDMLLEQRPAGDDEWLYLKANCQRELMRRSQAAETYRQLLSNFPDSPFSSVSLYELALVHYREQQFEEVLELLSDFEPPDNLAADAAWLRAESFRAMEREDRAVEAYRLAADAADDDERASEALYRVARILRKRGDAGAAIEQYREVSRLFPDQPRAPQALFEAAYTAFAAGRIEDSVRHWAVLVERYPDSDLVEESLYRKARALLELGRQQPARKAFQDLLRHFPQTPYAVEVYYWQGVLTADEGDGAAAQRALERALERSPPSEWLAGIRLQLARALQLQGKMDEAAILIQQLLGSDVMDKLSPQMLEWLAGHQFEHGRYSEAEAAARMLGDNARDAPWQQVGGLLLGRALYAQGRRQEALEAFTRAAAAEGRPREAAESSYYKGRTALQVGDYKLAMGAFKKAAELARGDDAIDLRARSYFGLGRAAELSGDPDFAVRHYLAVGILFDNPELVPQALSRAAELLGQLGRAAERRETLDELRRRYPEFDPEDNDVGGDGL